MKTIFVDDELWMLMQFKTECSDIPDIELVGEFTSAEEALEYARENPVEFALLDIEMPKMNGVELAKELRKINEDVIIVFVSALQEISGGLHKRQGGLLRPQTLRQAGCGGRYRTALLFS